MYKTQNIYLLNLFVIFNGPIPTKFRKAPTDFHPATDPEQICPKLLD